MALRTVGVVVGQAGARLQEAVEDAVAAEDAGLGLVMTGEHAWENFSILGALATRTKRVELLTTSNWTRTPVTSALGSTTVNELSDGRFRLSLGAMPRPWSEGVHGIDYARPVERMRDYVGAMRAAFASRPGRPISYSGPFYTIDGYERPNEPRPFPDGIYLAVTRPGMTRLAGEIADGIVLNVIVSHGWIEGVALPALAEGLERAGRKREDVDVGVIRTAAIADDPAEAYELARQGLSFYFVTPYFRDVLEFHGFDAELAAGTEAFARGDRAAMAAAVTDRVVDELALVGTAETVRAGLDRLAAIVDFVVVLAPLEQTAAVTREQTRLLLPTVAAQPVDRRPPPFAR